MFVVKVFRINKLEYIINTIYIKGISEPVYYLTATMLYDGLLKSYVTSDW